MLILGEVVQEEQVVMEVEAVQEAVEPHLLELIQPLLVVQMVVAPEEVKLPPTEV
tara:strand:+ start:466 stop:630 length:165 start_codon:yes stop_codon:yes gene_type:complete